MTGYVALKTEKGWVKSRANVLVRRPHSLRVTLLDPAGMAWFVGTVNSKYVAYSAPAENLSEQTASGKGATLRIGQLKVAPYDFIRFIHPGIEPAWLENSKTTRLKKGVRVRKKDASFRLELGADRRIKSLLVQRDGSGPVRFIYSYTLDGGYSVEIDRKIRFEFNRIKTDGTLPDSLFNPPQLR
jgi:hypothetical protein